MRVILILADGMRPDVLIGNPSVQRCMGRSSYTLKGCTVFPSVTLPCHMSMFHSVDPDRHGTTTNAFAPQVRPIDGLIDLLHKNEKHCGMFYDWEELRDLARPGTLAKSYMVSQECFGYEKTNDMVTRAAIESLQTEQLDFVFIYLSAPDSAGHSYKWMSAEYWKSVQSVWENVDRILEVVSDDDVVIITADHGGHDRTHGTRMREDMEIPLFLLGPNIEPNKELQDYNIKDIAPTICKLFGIPTPKEWEGNVLV